MKTALIRNDEVIKLHIDVNRKFGILLGLVNWKPIKVNVLNPKENDTWKCRDVFLLIVDQINFIGKKPYKDFWHSLSDLYGYNSKKVVKEIVRFIYQTENGM